MTHGCKNHDGCGELSRQNGMLAGVTDGDRRYPPWANAGHFRPWTNLL